MQERQERHKKRLYTKKFIVIQSGCDTFCTFCLTIYKRWSNRNRPLAEIIDEVNEFVALWWNEIVLTGVNLAAWWATHTRKIAENKFSELLEAILQKTSIERIRISSLWPEFLDDQFFELMHDSRFLPHFHFSIQHFDTGVLKLMNRNYDYERLDTVLTRIRSLNRPDRDLISIGADLIVWFPSESQEAFAHLCQCVEQYWLTKLHAFPFSPHQKWETVPAWSFADQISAAVKKERMDILLAVWDRVRETFINKNKGIKHTVLVEGTKDWTRSGWTWNYIHCQWEEQYHRGSLVEVVL